MVLAAGTGLNSNSVKLDIAVEHRPDVPRVFSASSKASVRR